MEQTLLNENQRQAVEYTEGPLLVIAGAGAGKTKVITERIIYLITKRDVLPSSILAITFTNKAASEMRTRVRDAMQLLPVQYDDEPFLSTFHSLCVFILRNEYAVAGLKRNFSIFDKDDSKRAIRAAMKSFDPEIAKQFEPGVILGIISREKNDGRTRAEFSEGREDHVAEIVDEAWRRYDEILTKENAVDFDDLLVKSVRLLETHQEIRHKYISRWNYIHIDEYHDTNKIQYALVKLLVGEEQNICAVGDVDQSIYSWRGADIKNIIRFEKDFPGTKTILLEENYRSTQTILDVANSIIQKNKNRFEKNLFTKKIGGEKISVYEAFDEADEARFVATKAKELVTSGTSAEHIAVLYRANFQSRAIEEAFLNEQVPHIVLGTRFFDRKEIKDMLSYLKVAMNPQALGDIARIINAPARGIGKSSLAKIFTENGTTLPAKQAAGWNDFKMIMKDVMNMIETKPASVAVLYTLKRSGIEKMLSAEGEEGLERLENITELVSLAARYDGMTGIAGIEKLLENAALATDQDDLEKNPTGVRLSTVHASKGLEFDVVFVAGLEQDLFPHKPIENSSRARDDEEERRLFYVALTRARKKIYLSHAGRRMIFGTTQFNAPSEFLFDIPEDLVEPEEKIEYSGKVIYFDI
ncbi:MAG TPA: UvrD-helicase domain-containing protein [Candidatus Paceibacterota bacterium]|nr:UvrD-helicase domain-containing protein [Candidatus Paceibacterota bacterium]